MEDIFSRPIRGFSMTNMLIPVLYSDVWGDYWGYFSFTSGSLSTGRNQASIGDYLARVNLVSLIPTFLLFYGFKESVKSFRNKNIDKLNILNKYLVLAILVSFFGYLWFLISFPNNSGDTNKATYIIHLFHLLGLCSAIFIEKLKSNKNLEELSLTTNGVLLEEYGEQIKSSVPRGRIGVPEDMAGASIFLSSKSLISC